MKKFTTTDRETGGPFPRISCDKEDLIDNPLWFHVQGLQETASGYGKKLTTRYMIHYNGKKRRIYCACFSNAGTCYIIDNGEWLVIDAM